MSVLCPNIETALEWMNLPNVQKLASKKRLGGKNTVIVPVKDNIVSSIILGKNGTLGIRIPQNDFCANISKKYPNPITTTSVNQTGFDPHINPTEINKEFKHNIDLLIDNGIINGKGSKNTFIGKRHLESIAKMKSFIHLVLFLVFFFAMYLLE